MVKRDCKSKIKIKCVRTRSVHICPKKPIKISFKMSEGCVNSQQFFASLLAGFQNFHFFFLASRTYHLVIVYIYNSFFNNCPHFSPKLKF